MSPSHSVRAREGFAQFAKVISHKEMSAFEKVP